jgi:hypothetical protein
MARSIFYEATFERRFALPFLFFEHLAIVVKEYKGDPDDAAMNDMLKESMKACLGMDKVSDKDMEYVAERLTELADRKKPPPEARPTKKSFATSYAEWVSGLTPDLLCLVLADNDFEKARHLFCEVDKDDVMSMSEAWISKSWEDIKIAYECCVYGFGGGYKDSGPEGGGEVDASTNDNAQGKVIPAAALAAVKF